MNITAIKQQVKNAERASIFVDGKYSFSLGLGELVAERLKVGMELSAGELERLKKLSAESKLKMRALAWVLMRPHSVKEFRDYLKRKDAEPELADTWSEEFLDKKYLDDAAFAAWWIETRRSSKSSSGKKLKLELMQKGVERHIIEEVLAAENSDEELEALKRLVAKKQKLARYQADQQKFIRYLMGQGYRYDLVTRVLRSDD